MIEHTKNDLIALPAYKLAETNILHLKQHTFQEQTVSMYCHLHPDPTFKQTKCVLGIPRKLPGPELLQNNI